MARGFTAWIAAFLSVGLGNTVWQACVAEGAVSPPKSINAIAKTTELDAFVHKVLRDGSPNRVPGALAELIGVPKNIPTYNVKLSTNQTSDNMSHLFKVLVERSPNSNDARPVRLTLMTTYKWPGNYESYLFRVSLQGVVEKVVFLHGKLDKVGWSIKGSATTQEKDINSPEIKERFQHEMDLWLKKTYLKQEWRSAEFSAGVLQKESGAR